MEEYPCFRKTFEVLICPHGVRTRSSGETIIRILPPFSLLLLFDLMFLEEHPLPNNWIEFHQGHFVLRIGNIFVGGIKESRSRRTQQFDGNGLALAPCHVRRQCRVHD